VHGISRTGRDDAEGLTLPMVSLEERGSVGRIQGGGVKVRLI
jgi:hypothetical protein